MDRVINNKNSNKRRTTLRILESWKAKYKYEYQS